MQTSIVGWASLMKLMLLGVPSSQAFCPINPKHIRHMKIFLINSFSDVV